MENKTTDYYEKIQYLANMINADLMHFSMQTKHPYYIGERADLVFYINNVKVDVFERLFLTADRIFSPLTLREEKAYRLLQFTLRFRDSVYYTCVQKKRFFVKSTNALDLFERSFQFLANFASACLNRNIFAEDNYDIFESIIVYQDILLGVYQLGKINSYVYERYNYFYEIAYDLYTMCCLQYHVPNYYILVEKLLYTLVREHVNPRDPAVWAMVEAFMGRSIHSSSFPRKLLPRLYGVRHNLELKESAKHYRITIFTHELSFLPVNTQKKIDRILSRFLKNSIDRALLDLSVLTYDDDKGVVGLYALEEYHSQESLIVCREGMLYPRGAKSRMISRLNTQYAPILLRHISAQQLHALYVLEREPIDRFRQIKRYAKLNMANFLSIAENTWMLLVRNDDLRHRILNRQLDLLMGRNMLPMSNESIERMMNFMDKHRFDTDYLLRPIQNTEKVREFVLKQLIILREQKVNSPVIMASKFGFYNPDAMRLLKDLLGTRIYLYEESDLIQFDEAEGKFTLIKLEPESRHRLYEEYDTHNLISALKFWIKLSQPLSFNDFSAYGRAKYQLTSLMSLYDTPRYDTIGSLLDCAEFLIKNKTIRDLFDYLDDEIMKILFDKIVDYCTVMYKVPPLEEIVRCLVYCLRSLGNIQNVKMMKMPPGTFDEGDVFPVIQFWDYHYMDMPESWYIMYCTFYSELKKNKGFCLHLYCCDLKRAWQSAKSYFSYFQRMDAYCDFFSSLCQEEITAFLRGLKKIIKIEINHN